MNKSHINFIVLLSSFFLTFHVKGQIINSEKNYFYQSSKHSYPTKIETPESNGSIGTKIFIYPADYALGSAFTDTMIEKRLLGNPVEVVDLVNVNGTLYVKSGSIYKYNTLTGLLESELRVETAEPIELAHFKFSNASLGQLPYLNNSTQFNPDSRYKIYTTFDIYTNLGKLVQSTSSTGISKSYIYDADGDLLLAEIANGKLSDVAFTSFEPNFGVSGGNNFGGWNYMSSYGSEIFGGGYAYLLNTTNGTVSKTGLNPNKTYTLSYWKFGNNMATISGATVLSTDFLTATPNDKDKKDWIFVRHKITNATSIVLSGDYINIDELRLHPIEAQMTTYSYFPRGNSISRLVLTEKGDEEGMIIRFEYDDLGRVISVKDSFHNTLESTKYQIKN